MRKQDEAETAFILRLALRQIKPVIWRKVAAHPSTPLDALHQIIQALFLWDNMHLHEFSSQGRVYRSAADVEESQDDSISEDGVTIDTVLKRKGDKILYQYDFGDGWEIEITLEGRDAEIAEIYALPMCLDGERAAPPEDCGGIPGYQGLVEAVENPKAADSAERLMWLGRPWNPKTFDVSFANRHLDVVLDGLARSEAESTMAQFCEEVEEQLEGDEFENVRRTFLRLTEKGHSPEEAVELISLALMQERVLSEGKKKIDSAVYSSLLDHLPNLPWIEEFKLTDRSQDEAVK